ncbi:MAG: hypothetical protein AAF747_06830 [Planctomycetota bacterium]
MHLLTKVFVVFAAVLALILSTLTVAYSANADALTKALTDAEARAAQESATKDAAVGAANAAAQRARDEASTLQSELSAQRRINNDLETQNASLLADVRRSEEEKQAIQSQIGDFVETINAQTALLESVQSQLDVARQDVARLRRESLALEDDLNDLLSQNAVLEQTVRAQREELESIRRQTDDRFADGTTGGGSQEPFELTGPLVTGRVAKVEADEVVGSGLLVEIGLGTNDRVTRNSRLFVTRGDRWIADVVVLEADLNRSVARVEIGATEHQVRANDTVLSRLDD